MKIKATRIKKSIITKLHSMNTEQTIKRDHTKNHETN